VDEVKLLKNSFKHTIDIVQDVVVAETNDVITAFFQRGSMLGVQFRSFTVLTAIGLDNQFSIECDEVDNESCDRNLPFEFNVVELARAKSRPQQLLGFGRALTKCAGVTSHKLSPLTLPSPQRGEYHFT
jgi:hypothetical protein